MAQIVIARRIGGGLDRKCDANHFLGASGTGAGVLSCRGCPGRMSVCFGSSEYPADSDRAADPSFRPTKPMQGARKSGTWSYSAFNRSSSIEQCACDQTLGNLFSSRNDVSQVSQEVVADCPDLSLADTTTKVGYAPVIASLHPTITTLIGPTDFLDHQSLRELPSLQ